MSGEFALRDKTNQVLMVVEAPVCYNDDMAPTTKEHQEATNDSMDEDDFIF